VADTSIFREVGVSQDVEELARSVEEQAEKAQTKMPAGHRDRVFLSTEEAPFYFVKERGTRRADLIGDSNGFPANGLHQFLMEIPPNSKVSMHRHAHEAIIYILQGKGYSIVDGVRYDWEAGDSVCMPIYAWHQHFNEDPDTTVVYMGTTDQPFKHFLGHHWKEEMRDGGKLD
jgi:quercetin dioxygenase-like cupin family protein